MTFNRRLWVRRKFDDLRARYGGRCQICGSTIRLEFAHLSPTSLKGQSRGKLARYYDVIKNQSSYALLCHTCHNRLDRKDS